MKGLTATAPTWFILKTEAPVHTAVGESHRFQVNRNQKWNERENGTERRRRRTNDIPSQNSLKFNKNREQNGVWRGRRAADALGECAGTRLARAGP